VTGTLNLQAGGVVAIKILLVDDDADFRQVAALTLETEGYAVIEAPNGWQALELLARERPDVIVSDLDMPGLDGLALYHRVRAEPRLATIPFVILSALVGPGVRSLPPGLPDCCLTKEGSLSPLITQIEALVTRRDPHHGPSGVRL
jgi:CheY-like chemotaxis protein